MGICLPNRVMAVFWFDGSQMAHGEATANELGGWVIDLDAQSLATPAAGTELYVTCNTPAGDQVTFASTVPS